MIPLELMNKKVVNYYEKWYATTGVPVWFNGNIENGILFIAGEPIEQRNSHFGIRRNAHSCRIARKMLKNRVIYLLTSVLLYTHAKYAKQQYLFINVSPVTKFQNVQQPNLYSALIYKM